MRRCFSLGFCCASLLFLTIAVLVVISPAPYRTQAEFGPRTLPKQPLAAYPKATEVSFEPNRGQTDPRVRYISRGAGRPLFLKPDGLVARLRVPESDTDHVVEMKIIGANAQAESEELDPRPGRSNYFVGNDPDGWQRGVRRYARVKFREVYPGIDLLYRGSAEPVSDGGQLLEYDFIVKPGADPGRIRLQFNGVEDVRVDDEGDLTLRTPAGDLRQLRPVVYQEIAEARRPVEGRFDLRPSGEVGFALGPYDSEWPLVIDPKVEYSTYLGGSGDDQAFGIKVGPDGSIYVTGWTESVNFPDVTAKGIGGNRDAFVASVTRVSTDDLESRPALNYSSVLGGFLVDQGQSLAVDADGNAYITGWTQSPNFPRTDGSGRGGGSDSFTAAFDPSGNLVFAGLTGGTGDDRGWSIDVKEFSGPEGGSIDVITAGGTNSRNGISTEDAFQLEYGGGDSDGWISSLRLDATAGAPFAVDNQSTSYLGGNQFDIVDLISRNDFTLNIGFRFDENDPIVGMTTSSDNMAVSPLAPHPTRAGGTDGYVAVLRLDQTGAAGWGQAPEDVVAFASYLPGGSRDEREVRVTIAENTSPIPQDRVYFSYNSFSNNVPTDENAAMSTNPGEQSYVLTRLERDSETGNPVFVGTTYGGGSQFDQAADLALDPNGAPAVVGLTFSQLPTTPNAIFPNRNGVFSGFLSTFSKDLTRVVYSTYMWGNPNSNVTAIDFDPFGQIYIVGINGPGALITPNAFQTDFGGGRWDVTIGGFTRPFVFNNGIGNGASFRPGASPQQISVVVGGQIGPQPPALLRTDGDGLILVDLDGARVLVNGEASPMTFASQFQDNFSFRSNVGFRFLREKGEDPPVVTVQVEFEGDLSNAVEVPVMEANPGLFAFDGSGQGQGAILNPDFSVNSAANPAPGDSFVIVYGTGGGITDPLCPDGGFGPLVEPFPRLQLPVQVFVDGVEVNHNYAGSAPDLVCGVNQFNVIPTNNPSGPAVPIQVCVNEVCSNIVTAAFQ